METEKIIKIRKLFYKFTDGTNGKFVENVFYDNNKIDICRKNKAIISRGNIKYLQEKVLEIIKQDTPFKPKGNNGS